MGFTGRILNLYEYVRNSPTVRTDPLGLQPIQYGNWGGQGWTNHQWQSEISNFPWRDGQKGFQQPIDPRDLCYYAHDVCLHNCARIKCNPDRRRCRRQCDNDLASCLQSVLDNFGDNHFPPTIQGEIDVFGRGAGSIPHSPNDTEDSYTGGLKFYDPSYNPSCKSLTY